jgi:hypothetical protein
VVDGFGGLVCEGGGEGGVIVRPEPQCILKVA